MHIHAKDQMKTEGAYSICKKGWQTDGRTGGLTDRHRISSVDYVSSGAKKGPKRWRQEHHWQLSIQYHQTYYYGQCWIHFISMGTGEMDWVTIQFLSDHSHCIALRNWESRARVNLTHWGRDKLDAISQTIFSNAFSWIKMLEFRLRFHWCLFLRF